MSRLRFDRIVVFSLALVSAACVSTPPTPASPFEAPREERTYVTVVNDQVEDVHVYAVRASSRLRIGHVGSGQTRRFRLAPHQVQSGGTLELVAELRPSRGTRGTGVFTVLPGQQVRWHLTPGRALTSLMVR